MSDVAAEIGLSLPLSLNHPTVLTLAGKSGLPVSMSDLLGKSGGYTGPLVTTLTNVGGYNSWSVTFPAPGGNFPPVLDGTLQSFSYNEFNQKYDLEFRAIPSVYVGNMSVMVNGQYMVLSQSPAGPPGSTSTWALISSTNIFAGVADQQVVTAGAYLHA